MPNARAFLHRSPLCMSFAASMLCAASHRGSAQVSIYGTVAVTNYAYSFNNDSLTISKDRVGFALGALYQVPVSRRISLGADLRGGITPGVDGGDKVLLSGRIAFIPERHRLQPYFQAGGGVIQAKVPASTNIVGAQTVTRGGLDLALGADFRLTPSFGWRLLELESGAGASSVKNAGSASISTGILYRFGGRTP